ncbi:MAG TPA: pyridoxamine 5'-phosphate oxidase family protein [Solirubrobacteraceae bacterium]
MSGRRDQIRMTPDEVLAFLDESRTVTCATNGRSGWPHLMPLWFVVRPSGPGGGPEIWAWTFTKSQKTKNLERDARATLQVEAGTEYHLLRGVMLETDAFVHRDRDTVLGAGLDVFRRYAGGVEGDLADEVTAMVAKQAEKRVALQFVERRRVTWDHRKLGGVY